MKKLLLPNTKSVRKVLLAIKVFGGTVVSFFLSTGKNQAAAITGLVIGFLDLLITMFSDGTNEIVKEKFEA